MRGTAPGGPGARRTAGLALAAIAGTFVVAAAAPPAGAAPIQDGPDAAPLVVGTKQAEPFAIRAADGGWTGLSIELWRDIAGALDLEYELVEVDLAELVDGLEAGRLDASVAALTITADRERRIDFTYPFHTSGLGIAVPAEGGRGRFLALLGRLVSGDFLRGVAALGAVLLVAGLAVWLFERRRNAAQFGGPPWRGLGSGFWWSAVTMTTVGYGDKAPVTIGGRLVAIVWMFASIITISGFTAAIASTLTVARLASSIQGPSDLAGVRVGAVSGSTGAAYLETRGIVPLGFATAREALAAMAEQRVEAVVHDAPILRYLVAREQAGVVDVLPMVFQPQGYAIGLPEDSAHRELVDRELLELVAEQAWRQRLTRYLGETGG